MISKIRRTEYRKTIITIPEITIGNNGWADIHTFFPEGIGNVKHAAIHNWQSSSPAVAFGITDNGYNLIGTAGQRITELEIRLFN
jgi:hypothetical protein